MRGRPRARAERYARGRVRSPAVRYAAGRGGAWYSAAMAQVAFIGLGKMGRPMATRLQQAGHAVHVFNRSRASVDALAALGATPAGSAGEAASRAEVVLTALPTEESVGRVYEELAAGARQGQIFADHSTVSLSLNRRGAGRGQIRSADKPAETVPQKKNRRLLAIS